MNDASKTPDFAADDMLDFEQHQQRLCSQKPTASKIEAAMDVLKRDTQNHEKDVNKQGISDENKKNWKETIDEARNELAICQELSAKILSTLDNLSKIRTSPTFRQSRKVGPE